MTTIRQNFKCLCGVVAVWLLVDGLPDASADETQTLWGLRARDRFVSNLKIVKETEVTIGDQLPVTSSTLDEVEIEYTVAQILNADDALIVARVLSVSRETGAGSSGSLQSSAAAVQILEDATIVFHVDSEGEVTRINPSDRDTIFAGISNMDTTTTGLLQDACPDEVIGDWFGRVFWIAASEEKIRKGAAWQSSGQMALGGFGTLRATAEFTPGKYTDGFTSVAIKGSGQFVPLVVPESRTSKRQSVLKDFTVELDEYSGKARMFSEKAGLDNESPPQMHPAFGSMELTTRIHGKGISTAAIPQAVTFRQTQNQTWILTKPTPGLGSFQFDIPIPSDAPALPFEIIEPQ